MSRPNLRWSRRTFIATAGLTAVDSMMTPLCTAEPRPKPVAQRTAPFIAYVGFAPQDDSASDRIESYRVHDGTWTDLGEPFAHQAPRSLALHPQLPILYAVHSNAQYLHLPRGSVSAYAIDPAGSLALANREPLSLSATYPEYFSISPDGRAMLVSSAGGSYNLFSVAAGGILLPTPYPLKQTGAGPHPLQARAHPHAVLFHPSGVAAYTSDLGADRVTQMTLANGTLTIASRVSFAPGSGPAHLARHPSGNCIVVSSQLRPALTVLPLNRQSGSLDMPTQQIAIDAEASGPVAINRAGDRVYATAGRSSGEISVSTYALSCATGRLRAMARLYISELGNVEQIALVDDQLLLAGAKGIASLPIDCRSGVPGAASLVIRRPGAVSIALRRL
jgi:6-phosphogluconolactonase